MRGGKSLADRGMIPRLLSSIYRKSRTLEKSSNGETAVEVSMSYYEIYNDRLFDLFEAPEKRTATGLPIREAEGGKTVVVGLTELPCGSLKEFEVLYDQANGNRTTSATKLNAHSSRSHAILCVKVTVTTPTETRVTTASAIDLAGSEDNRRTGNGKDRMVESASINKSLFVLAQCVEAISKKQSRIPYRESKMTRILSLGQNNGFTVMILNLAPVKAYHLDTLSSLNFANRTKKIEVREIEDEPVFKGAHRPTAPAGGPTIQRQPLRPLTNGININLAVNRDAATKTDKPPKAFSVYSDRNKTAKPGPQKSSPLKRAVDTSSLTSTRPTKVSRPTPNFIARAAEPQPAGLDKASIETLVEKKVSEILAARAFNAPVPPPSKEISEDVQRRLNSIEQRLEGQDGERAEGLSYLFMAKQHQARGENGSALKMYELAQPYFPDNVKLKGKIERLKEKLSAAKAKETVPSGQAEKRPSSPEGHNKKKASSTADHDESYHEEANESVCQASEAEGKPAQRSQLKKQVKQQRCKARASSPDPLASQDSEISGTATPRTKHLLDIINTRDVTQIKTLSGLGAKRAEGIVDYLNEQAENGEEVFVMRTWNDLTDLRGIGKKTLETMREGVLV